MGVASSDIKATVNGKGATLERNILGRLVVRHTVRVGHNNAGLCDFHTVGNKSHGFSGLVSGEEGENNFSIFFWRG